MDFIGSPSGRDQRELPILFLWCSHLPDMVYQKAAHQHSALSRGTNTFRNISFPSSMRLPGGIYLLRYNVGLSDTLLVYGERPRKRSVRAARDCVFWRLRSSGSVIPSTIGSRQISPGLGHSWPVGIATIVFVFIFGLVADRYFDRPIRAESHVVDARTIPSLAGLLPTCHRSKEEAVPVLPC